MCRLPRAGREALDLLRCHAGVDERDLVARAGCRVHERDALVHLQDEQLSVGERTAGNADLHGLRLDRARARRRGRSPGKVPLALRYSAAPLITSVASVSGGCSGFGVAVRDSRRALASAGLCRGRPACRRASSCPEAPVTADASAAPAGLSLTCGTKGSFVAKSENEISLPCVGSALAVDGSRDACQCGHGRRR